MLAIHYAAQAKTRSDIICLEWQIGLTALVPAERVHNSENETAKLVEHIFILKNTW